MDEEPRRARWWKVIFGAVLLGLAVAYVVYARGWLAPRPRLVEVQPAAGEEVWSARPGVVLRFSAAVSREQLTQAVRLDPPVAGRWVSEHQGRMWRFVPAAPGWPRGTRVTLHLNPPLTDAPRSHTFRIRPRLLAYLWPHTGPAQVYARDPAAGPQARQRALTRAPHGVLTFAVTPDAGALVYSTANEQGGADLWWVDLPAGTARPLVVCGAALCDQPRISPSGRLAFVREAPGEPRQVQVWNAATATAQAVPARGATYGPLWSPENLLAYYDQAGRAYVFWALDRGIVGRVPNDTGEHAAWAADGRAFYHVALYEVPPTEPDIPDPRLSAHLLRYDLDTRTQEDLTRAWHWEDATPAADPTGRYLAFGRKNLRPEAWTPGRQLWLYDLTRAAAYPLTDAAAYNHLDFAWAPDGQQLAYVRTHQLDLSAAPELWLYDLAAQHHTLLLEGAYAPRWLP